MNKLPYLKRTGILVFIIGMLVNAMLFIENRIEEKRAGSDDDGRVVNINGAIIIISILLGAIGSKLMLSSGSHNSPSARTGLWLKLISKSLILALGAKELTKSSLAVIVEKKKGDDFTEKQFTIAKHGCIFGSTVLVSLLTSQAVMPVGIGQPSY